MKRFNAIYNNGEVELIDKPDSTEPTKVFVLFPDENTEIRALRGAKKSKSPIDYSSIISKSAISTTFQTCPSIFSHIFLGTGIFGGMAKRRLKRSAPMPTHFCNLQNI